ncbi:phospholipase D/nuclease [Pilatotrama ljubarskyi]|nr:phospholipase D/nuclease [Pilatotrama ljubarskyi]
MDDPYEDDIARAIRLSLEESNAPTRGDKQGVIDVDAGDEDDEETRFQAELQRAIEASKAETFGPSQSRTSTAPTTAQASESNTRASSSGPSWLSERAQLERERLARLKRTHPHIDPRVRGTADESEDEVEGPEGQPGAKRQRVSSSHIGARRTNAYASASSSTVPAAAPVADSSGSTAALRAPATAAGSSQGLFWDGELRQTANMHVDPRKDTRPTFRLSEIIGQKEEVEFAIVSAFCWNFPWVYAMFHPSTPVIAVDHSPTGDASIKTILPNWIRTTPFLRNGFGCMHMKFMLLFYKTGRLRVVVSTANLVDYDWRDIENTVWVQDVPKRQEPVPPPANPEDFPSTMIRVLHSLNVAPALISHLRNDHPNLPLKRLEDLRSHWDFSRVKAALVPSIAGKHEGWPKVILTGHTRLMKALLNMGATTPKDKELILECQGSSIGNYSTMWMNEFYRSARGESTQSWLELSKARRAKAPYPPIKILFPTTQYVRESRLGESGGGTMFCRRKQWEAANFPRELFHQTRSKRGPVLMHSKMILGTFRDKKGTLDRRQRAPTASDSDNESQGTTGADAQADNEKLIGWVYVGSHNFTPSAWGTLSGTGFNPILNVTNYELGIVLPLRSEEEIDRVACWERPPQKYALGRDEPWMQTESAYFVEDV